MVITLLFLGYMAFLFKYSNIDKGWLGFSTFIGVLVLSGYHMNMFKLIIWIAIFKVLKDLFAGGTRVN